MTSNLRTRRLLLLPHTRDRTPRQQGPRRRPRHRSRLDEHRCRDDQDRHRRTATHSRHPDSSRDIDPDRRTVTSNLRVRIWYPVSRVRRPPCFWIVLDVTLPCVSDSYPLRFGCPSGLFFPVRGGGPSSSDKSIHVYPVSSPGIQLADTAVLWFRGRSPLQIPDGSLRVPPGC